VTALAALWTAAPAATRSPNVPFGERASLRIEKTTLRAQGASPALLTRLDGSAFRYFRLLANQFSARVCFGFRDLQWRLPAVAVHGDAHLEQFVITRQSYGLEDFDRAGFGPAVVDLVRYAASLHLACREVGWRCNSDQAVAAYFDAYHAALEGPITRTAPSLVGRLRAEPQESETWLQWAESLMLPLPAPEEEELRKGWGRFVRLMQDTRPERTEAFYRIVRVGRLVIGLGSALEPKMLIRIAGPSARSDDDVVLEARLAARPSGRECVLRPLNGGPLHALLWTVLLGPRLPDVFGFVPGDDAREAPEFWVQSWDPGYRELSLADPGSQSDVNELAVDAGHQLAGLSWTQFPAPLRGHQRFAQLRAFEMTSDRARRLARDLAAETVTAWERFRKQR